MEINNSDDNSADNMSIVSDITDIVTLVDESEININSIFENKIQKMNIDELKDKCKENFIIGLSKLKKAEIIQLLMDKFTKIWDLLKKTKLQDLRDIYKTNKMKDKYSNGTSKKHIINNIMNYNSKCETLQFIKTINQDTFVKNNKQAELNIEEKCQVKEDFEKQQQEEELKEKLKLQQQEEELKDKLTLQQQQEEEELKDKLTLQQQQEDEELKEKLKLQKEKKQLKDKLRLQKQQEEDELKDKLKLQKQQEEDEQKKKKSKIPKNVKINVWNTHIDPNIQRHKCLCCKKSIISITEFHVGHVISENAGGTLEINNLRPICASCNYSMGTTNMIDYIVKYGYYLS